MNSEEEQKKPRKTKSTTTKTSSKVAVAKKKASSARNSVKKETKKEEKSVIKEELLKEENQEEIIQTEAKEELEKNDEKKEIAINGSATFLQRFVAFIVDVFLVSIISSVLVFPFLDNDKAEKLSDESLEVIEKYSKAEISIETYATEMASLTYQSAKSNGVVTLVTLVCEILYFVVFQLYNNGQTLGKKLLKIKIVSDKESLTMNQMIFRSLIVNSILLEIISFCFMLFASKTVYFYGVATFEMLQYAILLISAFMIMWGKKGKGIHDVVAHTSVIKL